MKCLYCQGKMYKKTAHYNIDRKGYHLLLDVVPAWVCSQCGEAYFEETELESIQDVIRSIDQKSGNLVKSA